MRLIAAAKPAPGLQRVFTTFSTHTPQALCRHRPRARRKAGRARAERLFDARHLSRLDLHQRFQSLRPHLARDRAGRRAAPRRDRRHRPAEDPLGLRRHGAARRGGDAQAHQRPLARACATTSIPPPRCRATPRPGYSSGQALATMEQLAERRPCRRASATEWTELAYQQEQAGNTGILVFGLAVVFVFLLLAAQLRKPGAAARGDPDRADVSAGGDARRESDGPRQQHPDPDRAGGAGRPGRQERHPDRRVRQTRRTGSTSWIGAAPPSSPRASGCGPS